MAADQVKSADGQWFWDGRQWRSLLSGDGQQIWNGTAWEPLPPGTAVSSQPAPLAMTESAQPPSPPPAPAPWSPPSAPLPAPGATYGGPRYAGFWIRFLAYFIDALIISIPVGIIVFAFAGAAISANLANQSSGGSTPNVSTSPLNGLGLVLGFLYFSYFWSTGSTPGMRIFGLHVVDANTGGGIGFGRAALRYLGFVVSSSCCLIGLIWAAFDGRKQGWHDKIANTFVVQG